MVDDALYVAGIGRWIPARVDVTDAVARGLYDPRTAQRGELRSVAVDDTGTAPPQMAVRAAEIALRRARVPGPDLSLLLHATLTYQGMEIWNAAAYIQNELDCPQALSMEVRQGCNAGMAALELAASYLRGPDRRHALVTTADSFAGYGRWRMSKSAVFADGATALVLSRQPATVRLLSIVSVNDPGLEGLHRGDEPFHDVHDARRYDIDMDRRAAEFGVHAQEAPRRLVAGTRAVVTAALDAARVTVHDVAYWLLDNLARPDLAAFTRSIGIGEEQTLWEWGRTVGHIGAGDQFAGLDELIDAGHVGTGDVVVMLGSGVGWNWTCAVVAID